MELLEAMKLADALAWDGYKVSQASETTSEWIFSYASENMPNEPYAGGPSPLGISKDNGAASAIFLPSEEGFARLKDAIQISLPGGE